MHLGSRLFFFATIASGVGFAVSFLCRTRPFAILLTGRVSRSLSREKRFQLSIWVLQGHPLLPGLVEKQVADQLVVVPAPHLTEIDWREWRYPSALKTDAKLFSQLTVL
jgi:hypothetical protein